MTMPLQLTFLKGDQPLTKVYNIDPDTKQLTTKSFQNQKLLTSHTEFVETLEDFHAALVTNAATGCALLKGSLKAPLVKQSRAGTTANTLHTSWIMFDIDGIPDLTTFDDLFLDIPELADTSYIMQYSASYKVKSDNFNAHIFFLLNEPIHPRKLKSYLKSLNLRDGIKAKLQLNEAKSALKYLIDPTVADESRLIYIAPPVSNMLKVNKIFNKPEDRISIVKKEKDLLVLPPFDPAIVDKQINDELNNLRKGLGLKPKTSVEQNFNKFNEPYLFDKKPDAVKIYYAYTNVNAGFVYCNINAGDSKAYFFPFGKLSQQTIMRNFKNEPFFEIYKADPDFYNEWNREILPQVLKDNPELKKSLSDEDPNHDLVGLPTDESHFVAFDTEESSYKVVQFKEGEAKPKTTVHDLEKLSNYCEAAGIDFPEIKPIYRFITDITSNNTNPICHNSRVVNNWALPPLLDKNNPAIKPTLEKYAPKSQSTKDVLTHIKTDCPFIWSHLKSLFCDTQTDMERFANWYALTVFDRQKLRTSWILQGTQGTSKSFITQNLTRAIINDDPNMVPNKPLDVLQDLSNAWLEHAVFIEWEESSSGKTVNDLKTIDLIKALITGDTVNIRKMRTDGKQTRVNFNMVFTTNHNAPFKLDEDDRRFFVAPRQTIKWQHQLDDATFDYYDKHFDEILHKELPQFCGHMMSL